MSSAAMEIDDDDVGMEIGDDDVVWVKGDDDDVVSGDYFVLTPVTPGLLMPLCSKGDYRRIGRVKCLSQYRDKSKKKRKSDLHVAIALSSLIML
ncbi:hypothetical protein MRB53_023528 [Persea americana]|uniref:Uncharacterized protein n=1 Tax=Persea americana TaxID=3435 RepID=A0ACC2LA19_PERAE|nr:hypothetical protein MRB53_023528 [Persea americana]